MLKSSTKIKYLFNIHFTKEIALLIIKNLGLICLVYYYFGIINYPKNMYVIIIEVITPTKSASSMAGIAYRVLRMLTAPKYTATT